MPTRSGDSSRPVGADVECARCAYSLRGLDGQTPVCPECGFPIAQSRTFWDAYSDRFLRMVITLLGASALIAAGALLELVPGAVRRELLAQLYLLSTTNATRPELLMIAGVLVLGTIPVVFAHNSFRRRAYPRLRKACWAGLFLGLLLVHLFYWLDTTTTGEVSSTALRTVGAFIFYGALGGLAALGCAYLLQRPFGRRSEYRIGIWLSALCLLLVARIAIILFDSEPKLYSLPRSPGDRYVILWPDDRAFRLWLGVDAAIAAAALCNLVLVVSVWSKEYWRSHYPDSTTGSTDSSRRARRRASERSAGEVDS